MDGALQLSARAERRLADFRLRPREGGRERNLTATWPPKANVNGSML
jgi:hypothetical protein